MNLLTFFLNMLLGLLTPLKAILGNEKGSTEIPNAHVDQFSANVMHLAQQKMSRLRQHCRQESFQGKSKFFDRIGKRKARKKVGRHDDVIYTDTPHDRRNVVYQDFYDADIVDDEDKLRVIMNPESEYAIAIAASIGRQMDEEIIAGALGDAFGGPKGLTATALPNSQKVAAFDSVALPATGTGLNVETLRAVRKKFKQAESIMPGEKLAFVLAAQQIDDLLANTEVTSADFNTVKALVDGEVNTYMGFEFTETELLLFNDAAVTYTLATGAVGAGGGTIAIAEGRRCFAMTKSSGVLCATAREVKGRISELPGKHYAKQVYGSLSIGVVRMEEVQVVEVICKEV